MTNPTTPQDMTDILTAEQQTTLDALMAKILERFPEICAPINKVVKHGDKKLEILKMHLDGASLGQISKKLSLSKSNVQWHLKHILPINIEYILKAANQNCVYLACTQELGELMVKDRDFDWVYSRIRWELGVPLHLQKPEVHSFLLSLLQ